MENTKLNELEEILLKAKYFENSESLGIKNISRRFGIDLLKKSIVGEDIIEFDSFDQAVETFGGLGNIDVANEIATKIKTMSLDKNIRIDRKIILRILLS